MRSGANVEKPIREESIDECRHFLSSLLQSMDEHKTQNLIPNSTQIPNVILDLVISRIPEAEARCLLYICRRTFGFHKESDRISFSQFINGIQDRKGRVLDYGAGLARASVAKGLRKLAEAEAIEIKKTSKGNYYRINLLLDVDKVVHLLNRSSSHTKSGSASRPESVQPLNLQKKGNKEKQSTRRITDPPGDNYTEIRKLKSELCRKLTYRSSSN